MKPTIVFFLILTLFFSCKNSEKEKGSTFQSDLKRSANYVSNINTSLSKATWEFNKYGIRRFTGYKDKVIVGALDGTLTCVDANNGKQVWVFKTDSSANREFSECPSIYNNMVFIGCGNGFFYAIDAESGNMLWKFSTDGGYFARSASTVVNDKVYFGTVTSFYCLDASSGKLVWQYKIDHPVESGDPPANCYSDGVIYFSNWDKHLYALNSESGKELWRYNCQGFISQPCVDSSLIFVPTTIHTSNSWEQKIYALDSKNGTVKWQYNVGSEFQQHAQTLMLAADNDKLYFAAKEPMYSDKSAVIALNKNSGQKSWKYEPYSLDFTLCNSTIALTNNIIFVGTVPKSGSSPINGNNIIGVDASTGQEKWRFHLNNSPSEISIYKDNCIVNIGTEKLIAIK